ncbi:MAG: AMP-binding protein [Candidatus Cloacimonetes bacterium]|jgi:acyl-CoA synthetase (AMP-forming)/AMP-acid ligase II/acyl carrier protein|nr:AMP-binding protein [Candidatus Cloacimonadota bacterium]MDY0344527.1 AMP-binding protein [Lentimicrobium sp.]
MALNHFLNDSITTEDTYLHTLPEILSHRAKETPDEVAYTFLPEGEAAEISITYASLDRAAIALAAQLRLIADRGERALMFFPPGLEFIKALFGCFYAGIIAVPAYPPRKNRSLERIKVLVEDAGCTLVLSTAAITHSARISFAGMDALKQLPWINVDEVHETETGANLELPAPQDVALLQYTSGSTGAPKGVMVTHQNFMRNAESWKNCFRLTRQSIAVTWLPCFHDLGLNDGILVPMYVGYRLIVMPPVAFLQQPVRWLKAITIYSATHTGGPNFAFDHCVDGITAADRAGLDLSSLHSFYCGSEPVRKATFDRFTETFQPYGFRSHMLQTAYGMAESTLVITTPDRGRGPLSLCLSASALEQNQVVAAHPEDADARYLVGIGHPWIDTEVQIVHPETTLPCEDDEVGEIWVHGSIVTRGYWKKPELNAEMFEAQIKNQPGKNWLRTGDLGFIHQGEVYITGRLKDLIIIHGKNFYPQDIEFVVTESHPDLKANACAAFSIEVDEEEKLVITAEVKRTVLRRINVDSICEAIRRQVNEEFELSVHAIQLLRTASLPKTSSGKIQRKASKKGYLEKNLAVVGEWTMPTPDLALDQPGMADPASIETWLVNWLHRNLGIPAADVDLSKPITVYGLNSLKAIQLQQDVLDSYDINIPPHMMYNQQSLKELCKHAMEMLNV